MHLAEGDTYEAAFLRGKVYVRTVKFAQSYDETVIELGCQIEEFEMRTQHTLLRTDQFTEAAFVKQTCNARAR